MPSLFLNINVSNIDAVEEKYYTAGCMRTNGCNRITGKGADIEETGKGRF